MNSEPSVDNNTKVGYNESNDLNEHIIDMSVQKPINDVDCRHDMLIADPEDTLGDAVYHGCINPKCGVGFYLRKK